MSLSRSKVNQNVIFECNQFFKIWHVEKTLIQKLTRCIFLNLKSDALKNFKIKIWRFVFFNGKSGLLDNSFFKIYFWDHLFRLSLNYHQKTTCWIKTMAWGKKIFSESVAFVCLTFGTIFLVVAIFMALGFLMGVMTISFALPIYIYISLRNSEKG